MATSRILTGGLLLGAAATLALLLLSLIGRDGLGALVPLVMLSNAAFGLVSPNAAHEALQPMRAAAGVASAVFRCAQMLAGAAASTLVPLLFRGYPAAMTGVMAGCAVAALMIYLAALRRPGTTTLEVAPAPRRISRPADSRIRAAGRLTRGWRHASSPDGPVQRRAAHTRRRAGGA